jgi:hypothetical protein
MRVPWDLDISKCDLDQKKEILKYAAEVRKFEIERFWQRSGFFWLFIGAAFIAYATLYKEKDSLIPLLIGSFGVISSLAWTLQNRGSKYWQEAWEHKVEIVEVDVLGTNLFSNIEPLQRNGIWGARRYSVSRLATAISDFTFLIWITLMLKASPIHLGATLDVWASLTIIFTIVYAIVIFAEGRSGRG